MKKKWKTPKFKVTHHALFLLVDPDLEVVVLPAEERRQRHDHGRQPDHQDHRPDRPKGPRVNVMNVRHSPIPESEKK